MLKTIKKSQEFRLDELLEFIWVERITNAIIYSDKNAYIKILDNSDVLAYGTISKNDTFEMLVEEEIKESMVFDLLLELWLDDDGEYHTIPYTNNSIELVKDSNSVSFYALIDGRLQLIWERENQ